MHDPGDSVAGTPDPVEVEPTPAPAVDPATPGAEPAGSRGAPALTTGAAAAAAATNAALDRVRSFVDGLRIGQERRPTPPTREAVLAGRLATLGELGEALARSGDAAAVFRTIVEQARRELQADTASVRVLRSGRLEPVAWAGMPDERAARLPAMGVDEPWFRSLVAEGGARAVPDIRAAGRPGYERHVGEFELGGELAAPLFHDDRPIGFLRAVSRKPRRWSDDDVALMAALARHAAVAARVQELAERAERRGERLAAAQAAAARLIRERTPEAIGRAILDEVRRVIPFDAGHVHVLEPTDELVAVAVDSHRAGAALDPRALRTHIESGFTGWVAEHGEPLLVHDATADPRGSPTPGSAGVDESLLVVPLRTEHGTVGVVTLSSLGLRRFDEDDLRLVTIVASQASTALESGRLRSRVDASMAELQPIADLSAALARRSDQHEIAQVLGEHVAEAADVDGCAVGSWDRVGGRIVLLGGYPAGAVAPLEPAFDVAAHPAALRALETRTVTTVDAGDPATTDADRALLRRHGRRMRMLTLLPLVGRGEVFGLVELVTAAAAELDEERLVLARTMVDTAAMALESARLQDEMRALADRDPLTGLRNHRYVHERLGEEILRAHRSRRPLSLLMIDVDDFGLVNETFGHLVGDRVLVWAAERIRSTLRASDVAARYGADEFAVVLPDTDADAARVIAERIATAAARQPHTEPRRGPVPLGLSIGAATHPADGRTASDVVAAAAARLDSVRRGDGQGIEAAETPARPMSDGSQAE